MKLLNPLVVLRILSTLLFLETLTYLTCVPVAYIYKESPLPFLWSSLITVIISLSFYLCGRKTSTDKITNREGFMSVSLGWILFTILGGLPYIISGTAPSFIDSFFESSSGFTTTGSSIFNDVEVLPYSILFWRSLTHWIGGLGIIVLVIILIPSLNITRFQFLGLESSLKVKIHPKTKSVGLRLLYIYLTLTLLEVILLLFGGMNLFDSICHTFGTVATGGFSTKNNSIAGYSAYIQYIIGLFMFLSGVSFVIYYYIAKLNFRKVKQNEELWFYLANTIFAGAIATSILLAKTTKPLEPAFREGFFQVISIASSTGYVNADYILWPPAGLCLIFVLLFAGASTGSTSGGIKMLRHLVVIKSIRTALVKLMHRNMLSQIRLNNKPLPVEANISVLIFVVTYFFIFLLGTIIVVSTGIDPVTGASAVASSMGNIGPGLGNVAPMNNYAQFSDFNKLVLSLLMIVGRLEIFTVYVLFTRSFWKL